MITIDLCVREIRDRCSFLIDVFPANFSFGFAVCLNLSFLRNYIIKLSHAMCMDCPFIMGLNLLFIRKPRQD